VNRGIGQWFVGGPLEVTQDIAAIGNVYKDCGYVWPTLDSNDDPSNTRPCVDIYPANGVIFTHNEIDGGWTSTSSVRLLNHGGFMQQSSVWNAVFAHNRFLHAYQAGIRSDILAQSILVTNNVMTYNDNANTTQFAVYLTFPGTWDIRGNQAQTNVGPMGVKYGVVNIQESVPQTPTLVAIPSFNPDQVELRWDGYPDVDAVTHDSFYIFDFFDSEFRRVAYRPPNDPRWTFDTNNTDLVQFDMLGYVVRDLESGTHWFGIRAQNGSKNSGVSVVQVNVP
jgi:hypothetical protein